MEQLFSLLGTDCRKNIDVIVEFAVSLLETDFVFYLEKEAETPVCLALSAAGPSGLIHHRDIAGAGRFFQAFFIPGPDGRPVSGPSIFQPHEHPFLHQDRFALNNGIRTCLAIPVILPEGFSGALVACDTQNRNFSPDDIRRLEALASALALEEKRLEKELGQQERLKQAEKMELIGVVAGGVAHDLNNILSGLVSYPELLLMQIDRDSSLYDPISFINDAGLKAAEIVQDLLTLTRRSVSQPVVINLNRVVEAYFNSPAYKRLEQNFPQVRFLWEPGPDLLNIRGSESHISKVVMNLVMNAAEAVEDMGEVTIQTLNWYVDFPNQGTVDICEGEYIRLRVTDNGQGIPEADLQRIFEPFYTKKQMGRSGSGLGLSVVWNAVKDHNGYIDVISPPDQGTTFDIYFPATREASQADTSGFSLEKYKGSGEKVLVIDDVKEQRQIARKCLDMIGYTPFAVDSGEKAVDFLKKQPVDLLILDMKMEPGIDGLETFRRVLDINPGQKAIIASGFSETNRVKKTLSLGAGQYIRKPYTIKKLAVAIYQELLQKNS